MISIIVIFKNEEKYLFRCIESILKQEYSNFELILINDNSSDKSEEIVQSFKDPRIRYYSFNTNLGISKARNVALSKAKGKYIFFTDGDCFVDKYWTSQGLSLLERGYDMIEGKVIAYKKSNTTIAHKIVENLKGNNWMTANIAYSKGILFSVKGYDEKFGNMMEDRDIGLRIKKIGKSRFNKDMVVYHHCKLWDVKGLIQRHIDQGRSKVINFKKHKDRSYIFLRIAFPFHLLILFFPPLLLLKGLKYRITNIKDIKILFAFFIAYVLERLTIWKHSIKEGVFVV